MFSPRQARRQKPSFSLVNVITFFSTMLFIKRLLLAGMVSGDWFHREWVHNTRNILGTYPLCLDIQMPWKEPVLNRQNKRFNFMYFSRKLKNHLPSKNPLFSQIFLNGVLDPFCRRTYKNSSFNLFCYPLQGWKQRIVFPSYTSLIVDFP